MPESFPELEAYFQRLTDITDNIAIINTPYDADHDKDFADMEAFFTDIAGRKWEDCETNYYDLFTSYFTFHMKIIEETIKEAREILNPEKRPYLKHLVNYSKKTSEWFAQLKRRRRTVLLATAV
ncbi:MAG: PLU-1-like domain protein [Leptospiraceae bacterium]|nr:PLU-1-like domain protein [Leptospiraceae bacterium]MCP5502301.1 PLU-1-like domain protein [Leptospiraceae bacterium]